VLRDAALLLVAAAIGKLVSPLGAWGSPGDKLLIGLGMLPRGEVGLIFATLGLQTGVLGDDLYAALLLVVLVTTLVTPTLLKLRYGRLRAAAADEPDDATVEPPGGWLRVSGGQVGLAARPPRARVLAVALEAAVRAGRNRPAPELLDWLADAWGAGGAARWAPEDVERFFDVVERGNGRSWRFLDTVGVLDIALPDLAEGIRARESGTFALDPLDHHRFVALERFRVIDAGDPVMVEADRVAQPELLLLALLLCDGLEAHRDPPEAAARIAGTLGFDATGRRDVAALVEDRELLWAAAHRAGGLGEAAVVPLATHLATPERARVLYVVSALRNADAERWELSRLRELHELVQSVLADEDLTGTESRDLVARHRAAALRLAEGDGPAQARIAAAPRSYLLSQPPEAIVRHAGLLQTVPPAGSVRVSTVGGGDGRWIDVAARDSQGLLAAVTGALADLDIEISQATVATWSDGGALETFCVRSPDDVPVDRIRAAIEAALDDDLAGPPLPEVQVSFDHQASPWHTACQVEAPDKPRLLHQLATAFAAARVDVVAATIVSHEGRAHDSFLLDRRGEAKLDASDEAAIERFIAGGVTTRRRRLRRPEYVPARVGYQLSGV
jgi:UTP:GlnB (protein PII) uridylyltransferase